MKHNVTFVITVFLFLCTTNIIYGMEQEETLNVYCSEDVAIVLHLKDGWYDRSYQEPDDYSNNYNKENSTSIAYNNINKDTKASSLSIDELLQNIEKTFTEAAQKNTAYNISAYLIASHGKYTSCPENNVTPSTLEYCEHARTKIYNFFSEYHKQLTEINRSLARIRCHKIFYKPSYLNDEQRECSDVQIVTENNETSIKITDKAIIDLQRHDLKLTMPNDLTIKADIQYLHPTQIKKANSELILDIQPDSQSIFLMDV